MCGAFDISGKLISFYCFVFAAVFNIESYMELLFLCDRIQNIRTTRCIDRAINNLRNGLVVLAKNAYGNKIRRESTNTRKTNLICMITRLADETCVNYVFE